MSSRLDRGGEVRGNHDALASSDEEEGKGREKMENMDERLGLPVRFCSMVAERALCFAAWDFEKKKIRTRILWNGLSLTLPAKRHCKRKRKKRKLN